MPRAVRSTAAASWHRAAASLLAPHPNHHTWAPAPSAMGLSTWIPAPSPTHFVSAPSALNLGLSPSPLSSTVAAAGSRWTPVYRWIPIVGVLITFAWSLAVGANDVAISVTDLIFFSRNLAGFRVSKKMLGFGVCAFGNSLGNYVGQVDMLMVKLR